MKAIAFRIRDFRSIHDTGECSFSGDNITVLAGQNEAGKSAALMALRDFDLEEGKLPATSEYLPEGNHEAVPKVSVLFEVDADEINSDLAFSNLELPQSIYDLLKATRRVWISRNLGTGKFEFDSEVVGLWPKPEPEPPKPAAAPQPAPRLPLKLADACAYLRPLWPHFVLFETFQDQLPRQIAVEALHQYLQAKTTKGATIPAVQAGQSSVEDFLELASVDLARVIQLKDQDKALGNYLKGRTTSITGDFLTYWKQSVDGDEQVELQVRHIRSPQGVLQFAFYVHDGVDQYPEQRSKGFLWFLSFYLRLAAAEKRHPDSSRILLIDEPGTFLHATAQRDVLHLFEDKLASKQQVVYSTHSPYLLPSDKLHRLRIVLRKGADGTVILDRLTHPTLRGGEFSDTLSPIISAIGLDVRERLSGLAERNLLVEGLSDYIYLTAWMAQLNSPLVGKVAIFPGTGAATLPTLASLCIGWGLTYAVLLDRDAAGLKTAQKFERELGLPPAKIVHPSNAVAIEDVFDAVEFAAMLSRLDSSLAMEPNETPSKAMKRQNIDKILLARKFAENPKLYPKSSQSFSRLLQAVEQALAP